MGEVISIRVTRVKRYSGTQCVNIIRRGIITRAICLRNVSNTMFKVIMNDMFSWNNFCFSNRINAFFYGLQTIVSFDRGLNYLARQECNRRIKKCRRLRNNNIVKETREEYGRSSQFRQVTPTIINRHIRYTFDCPLRVMKATSIATLLITRNNRSILSYFCPLNVRSTYVANHFPMVMNGTWQVAR